MDEDLIRERLDECIDQLGIKKSRIAEQLNISNTTLRLFLKKERKLSQQNLKKIDDLLKKINF